MTGQGGPMGSLFKKKLMMSKCEISKAVHLKELT